MKEKLVIIGNGMSPGRLLEQLVALAPDRYEMTVLNAEPRVNYNRIMLSPVLSGEKEYEDIITHDDDWYAAHRIKLHNGVRVVGIDRQAKTIASAGGLTLAYDRLVIATGSRPFIIPVPGHDLPGVLTYRDLDDVEAMLQACRTGSRAVVIGGGLLGLEAAAGLRARGLHTTVVHLNANLMDRQLDSAAAGLLARQLGERGIELALAANTREILAADGKVSGVLLDDGTQLPADVVVMAVGIRPEYALATAAGLGTEKGILVNDLMQTSDPDIYALGECAQHRGVCYGLVAPLYEMADVLARHLAHGLEPQAGYQGSVTATRLKVTGIDLFSAGDFAEHDGRDQIVLHDGDAGIYKRLVLKDNRIIGAVLYGETLDGPWYFELLERQTDITELRDTLIFGQAYQGGAPLDPTVAVAVSRDETFSQIATAFSSSDAGFIRDEARYDG